MLDRNRALMLAAAAGLAAGVAGPAQGQVRSWGLPVDGSWTIAANWSPADVPNSQAESAVLGLSGAYTVTLPIGLSVGGVSITNPDAVLDIRGITGSLNIYGAGLLNEGLVNVATNVKTNQYARLTFLDTSAPMLLDGSGVLRVDAGSNASTAVFVANGVTLVQGPDHTIAGNGRLDMVTTGSLHNAGLVVADNSGQVLTVSGTVRQEEGGASGMMVADGGILNTAGLKLYGGTIGSVSGGVVRFDENTWLYGPTLTGNAEASADSSTSYVYGSGFTNSGTITVAPNLGTNQYARLSFQDTSTPFVLEGSGAIRVNAGSNTGTRVLVANGVTVVQGPDHTIAGNGLVDMGTTGSLHNAGLIVADDPGQVLTVSGAVRQEEGGAAGAMIADGGTISTSGLRLHGGDLASMNGGQVLLEGITYFFGPTLSGDIAARANNTNHFIYGSGLTNVGTISIATDTGANQWSRLNFQDTSAPMSLGGTGEVRLAASGNPSTRLTVANGVTLVQGPDHTIAGNGRLLIDTTGRLHNEGMIVADDPGAALTIEGAIYQEEGPGDPGMVAADGGVLTSAGMKLHGGTLTAMDGGTVRFTLSTELHDVVVEALPGGAVEFGGVMTLLGTVFEGEGAVWADNTSHYLYGDGLTNNGVIRLATGTGTNFWTRLWCADTSTPMLLGGSGELRLDANGHANTSFNVLSNVTAVNGPDHTIAGEGRIGVNSGGRLHNEGLIVADEPGGVLDIEGDVYQEESEGAPGRVVADGGVVSIGNLRLHGGTLEGINGGEVRFESTPYLYDVTLIGNGVVPATNSTCQLYGTSLTNDGTILVATHPDTNAYARLFFLDSTAPMVLDGSGRLRLNGGGNVNTYLNVGFGVTLVHAGSHSIEGAGRILVAGGSLLQNHAVLSPGDEDAPYGAFEMGGPVEFGPTAEYRVGIGGTAAGMYDRITGFGTISLGGTLRVEYADGYEAEGGDEFVVITGSSITGEFDTLVLERKMRVEYHPTMVKVIRTCQGDFTDDGVVNTGDFSAFREAYLAGDMRADMNEDGVLSTADFSAFRNAYLGLCGG